MKTNWNNYKEAFYQRHIGPRDIKEMLKILECNTLDELVEKVTPKEIRSSKELALPSMLSESECLKTLKYYANQNKIFKNYIGMGYYETKLPPVIQRNILENPVWLTSYTPYQAEISQGRLQALLNFQTMIIELTEMDAANASLLDEGTATAEAISIAFNHRENSSAQCVFIDENIFPQTKAVLNTRAKSIGLQVTQGSAKNFDFHQQFFCVVIQYPNSQGALYDWENFCQKAKSKNIATIFVAEPLSLCFLKTPGAMGADMVTGSCQRLGVPLFFGGPHAGYIAVKEDYVRSLPGRIVGVSKDRHGKEALRLALQTREQHIRRERATSNICTAQALLAVLSSMYALYHGPEGLKKIAIHIHLLALSLAESFKNNNLKLRHSNIFDTVQVEFSKDKQSEIYNKLIKNNINVASIEDNNHYYLSFSINETNSIEDIKEILKIFNIDVCKEVSEPLSAFERKSPSLKHPVFRSYHSETQLLRYIHRLQKGDLSLTHSMIPLGSCTMKLNGTTELLPVTWPSFSQIHPFAPSSQTKGYRQMINELEQYLCEITGFSAVSFQSNAGSQGEYAGLLIIRRYHEENNNKQRNICLVPSSSHGTNPASAVMAGLKPITVNCDKEGNISYEDLQKKVDRYKNELAGLMITYPSTFGVFEQKISRVCQLIHSVGALVYLDGANMNSLIGVSRPAEWGADLCHLNLHKTFCIPHGGGGPGVGPVAVTKPLQKYLPSHPVVPECGPANGVSAISSAPWGSAGILMISWAYIRLMGEKGMKKATQVAILNANYIAKKLSGHYRVLYKGQNQMVAHECIIDFRKFKNTAEITVDDVAKRLIDYGFHAPTMSWPVPGTLMVEPTESEDKAELDRFCEALIAIREEIKEIEDRKISLTDNVLKKAPHTVEDMLNDWDFSYSKEKAFYPLPWVKEHKFWPQVSRVDNAYGDINLFCSCPSVE